jgi:hypothetical protein
MTAVIVNQPRIMLPPLALSRSERLSFRNTIVSNSATRRRLLDGALITLFALIGSLAIARVGLAPANPSDGIAVVFSPWTDAQAALARATAPGARFVRFGGVPFVAIVVPEAGDYQSRIMSQGALFLLDPRIVLACLPAALS